MSDTTSTTDELEADGGTEQTETVADPAVQDAKPVVDGSESGEEEPKRTVGLRKPTGRERGAMAATAMAAVPATGVIGSVVYGNFGPAGLAATAATGLAAGGVALAVRAKRRAEERAKGRDAKPGLPPHPLGGLKGLLAGAKEKAAARRQQMAERRAGRQGRGSNGGGGPGGVAGRVRAALGRGAGGGGRAAGTSRTPGATPPRGRHAAAGKPAAGRPIAGKPAAAGGRHTTPGGRPVGGRAGSKVAGRPVGGSRQGSSGRPAAGPRGGPGRYVNPATGRPMSPAQVSRAIRQQQRAQRVVTGNSYPRQLGRWAARHPKAVGIAAAGLGGLAAAVVFAPLAAAAAVGLGAFGVARHPAARAWCATAARGVGRGVRFHGGRFGRWVRGRWVAWRTRGDEPEPLEGEIVDEPTATAPEPDIVDAEVVDEPTPAPPKKSIGQPTLVAEPAPTPAPAAYSPPYRQPRLITAAATSTTEENTAMSHPFETATEALAGVSFVPESGAHAEAAIDGIPSVLRAAAASITGVIASIAEQLPQGAESLEHLQGIADAVEGIATQADEQIAEWKNCSTWVWQGQD